MTRRKVVRLTASKPLPARPAISYLVPLNSKVLPLAVSVGMAGFRSERRGLGEGLAVAVAGGHLVTAHGIGRTVVGEEDEMVERAARGDGNHLVAFTHSGAVDGGPPADPRAPAVASKHDVGVFLQDVG